MKLLPVIFLSACVTSATFGSTAAQVGCENAAACEEEGFDFLFDDVAACQSALAPLFGGECTQEHCTFNAQAANTCVAALRTSDCNGESPVDNPDCNLVWTECNVGDLTLCVVGISD